MRILIHTLNTLATFMVASVSFAQWQFRLDTTFRTQITEEHVNSLLIKDDGDIIISGQIKFPGDMSVRSGALLGIDGERNSSYPEVAFMGGKITPWSDRFYAGNGQIVRRLHMNGTLDNSFQLISYAPYFFAIQGGDYHVFEDGRVLVTGSHNLSDSIRGFVGSYKLIWFSNEGYLDTTRVHRQANGTMRRFTALPDGKFLCSCSCTMYDEQPVSRVFRIHADGELDTTFVSNITMGLIRSYVPLVDGRTYIGGKFWQDTSPEDTLYIARFLADGTMDPSFTSPHFSAGDLPNPATGAFVYNLFPWQDGNMIVTGRFRYVNGQPRNSICMIDSTGNLLPAFHDQGIGTFQWWNYTSSDIERVYQDDQGRLYICGGYTGYNDGTINDPGQGFVSRLLVEEDLTVAVEQAELPGTLLVIQPNPAADRVSFSYELPPTSGQVHLFIHDATGRLIHQARLAAGSTSYQWQRAGQGAGLYVVTVQDAHGPLLPAARLVLEEL